ncbi:MAG: hypothetical protein ACK40K_08360, partial [Raineya sp.]
MCYKYFSRFALTFFFYLIFTSFKVFSQDTIRYYKDNKLVEEVYFSEKDNLPKSTLQPRIAFGFQSLVP